MASGNKIDVGDTVLDPYRDNKRLIWGEGRTVVVVISQPEIDLATAA